MGRETVVVRVDILEDEFFAFSPTHTWDKRVARVKFDECQSKYILYKKLKERFGKAIIIRMTAEAKEKIKKLSTHPK